MEGQVEGQKRVERGENKRGRTFIGWRASPRNAGRGGHDLILSQTVNLSPINSKFGGLSLTVFFFLTLHAKILTNIHH